MFAPYLESSFIHSLFNVSLCDSISTRTLSVALLYDFLVDMLSGLLLPDMLSVPDSGSGPLNLHGHYIGFLRHFSWIQSLILLVIKKGYFHCRCHLGQIPFFCCPSLSAYLSRKISKFSIFIIFFLILG